MTECMDPTSIGEGDLIAYVEGKAGEEIADHVNRCAACAGKVTKIRETCHALFTLAYRADCPAPEVLGQYQMKLLSSAEELRVAAHVRTCPHCTREMAELGEEEDSLTQMILRTLQGAVQIVETSLMLPSRGQPVRTGTAIGEQATFRFHSDDADMIVGFEPSGSGGRRGELRGTIAKPEIVPGSRAWLFREGDRPISTPVDALGTFVFDMITPGEYDLALEAGEKALLMRGVVIDEP